MNGLNMMPSTTSHADALQKKHEAEAAAAAAAAHRVSVEDTVDEEDVAHPPPSASMPAASAVDGRMSAKAAGKQRATEDPPSDVAKKTDAPSQLNMQSHESFPQLGAGPQQRNPRPVAAAWGAKKSPTASVAAVNGIHAPETNGYGVTGSQHDHVLASLHAGIVDGGHPRTNHAASQRGPVPQMLSIPGKYSERISLYPQEMKPRGQLKKPVPDVLRDINKRSKATVQMLTGTGGAVHFEATGPVEAVRQSLKEVAKELGSKQSTKVTVPASVRPHIIGRQGTTITRISQRTGARIQVPRPDDGAGPGGDDDDEGAIEVLIEGDSVAAEMARREIEAIVNERTSTVNIRLKDIPAEFYPFLAGPHNAGIATLEDGREVRVHIPHQHVWTVPPPPMPAPNQRPQFGPARENPIRVSGERLAVQAVCAEIERQVQRLRNGSPCRSWTSIVASISSSSGRRAARCTTSWPRRDAVSCCRPNRTTGRR